MGDIDITQRAVKGYITDAKDVGGANMGSPETASRNLVRRRKIYARFTDGGTAGTAWTESPVFSVDMASVQFPITGITIIAVEAMFPIAVTANNSNYATLLLQQRVAAGTGNVTVATNTTQISDGVFGANIVAFKPYLMTLTAANVVLAAGSMLTMSVSKTGTGVALAAATSEGCLTIVYEEVY